MILVINTNVGKLAVVNEANIKSGITWISLNKENSFVSQVNVCLSQKNLSLDQIKSIIVIQGEGTFSDTRTGIVFANIMRLAYGVAVTAVKEAQLNAKINEYLKELPSDLPYLTAEYSQEPNIS